MRPNIAFHTVIAQEHRPRFGDVLVLAGCIVLLTTADAAAYVDPGTGSYIFQLAVAGALAAMYTLRRYGRALMGLVRRGRVNDSTSSSDGRRDGME